MQADWIWGFGGGVLIGCAGALYLLFNGRILGISGIYGGLVDGSGWSSGLERLAFVLGLVLMPWVIARAGFPAATHLTGNWVVVVTGGVLVGLGTRLANGCTSGHGVCGMSRLSPRGIVATLIYIAAGGVTMALLQHVADYI